MSGSKGPKVLPIWQNLVIVSMQTLPGSSLAKAVSESIIVVSVASTTR
jgi:hypothetical protein